MCSAISPPVMPLGSAGAHEVEQSKRLSDQGRAVGERWTTTSRSASLSGRRSRNTAPELALRSALHRLGLRFRVHVKIPPSRLTVDILLPRHRLAVQIYGCFWHRHGCAVGGGRAPQGPNAPAWSAKILRVKEAEQRGTALLMRAGFRVLVVWECEIRANVVGVAEQVASRARSL